MLSFLIFIAFIGLIGFAAYFVYKTAVVIVPTNYRMVLESRGVFQAILGPGLHLLGFFDKVRTVRWSYAGQTGRIVQLLRKFSTCKQQMDVPPMQLRTKENVKVVLDFTVIYQVTDVKKAVYAFDDTMNIFYQRVQDAIIKTVSDHEAARIRQDASFIAGGVKERMAKVGETTGISFVELLVQDCGVNGADDVAKETLKLQVRERQMEYQHKAKQTELKNRLLQEEAELNNKMKLGQLRMDHDFVVQKKQHEIAMAKEKHHQELTRMRNETQISHIELYLKAGFTPSEYIDLQKVQANGKMFDSVGKTAKTILLPHNMKANVHLDT